MLTITTPEEADESPDHKGLSGGRSGAADPVWRRHGRHGRNDGRHGRRHDGRYGRRHGRRHGRRDGRRHEGGMGRLAAWVVAWAAWAAACSICPRTSAPKPLAEGPRQRLQRLLRHRRSQHAGPEHEQRPRRRGRQSARKDRYQSRKRRETGRRLGHVFRQERSETSRRARRGPPADEPTEIRSCDRRGQCCVAAPPRPTLDVRNAGIGPRRRGAAEGRDRDGP